MWSVSSDGNQGKIAEPQVSGTTVTLDGDWSGGALIVGYEFTMSVKLPTIYPTRAEGDKSRSDIRSSLTIHRLKLSFGPIGVYDVTIDRYGKGSHTLQFDQREMDGYKANTIAVILMIWRQSRSMNVICLSVTISSTHPSPATLYSMTWEGDYSNRFYRRV